MNTEFRDKIAALLMEAGHAHHKAFEAVNGVDPDWSIWYAGNLKKPLSEALSVDFSLSQLIYCLMNADYEHRARAPESDWSKFYADELLQRFAPSETAAADKLALYHYEGCPFCMIVRSAIERLGIDVELRNILEDSSHRNALVAARGRATVPVLRIASPDGEDRWMSESRDIVRYLEAMYA